MFFHSLILLFICYNVKAEIDPDCNYYQQVIPPKTYYIQPPEYPASTKPNRVCRWVAECPSDNSVCRIDCTIEMTESRHCNYSRLLISRSGDETLTGADQYCGTTTLMNISSFGQKIVLGLVTSKHSKGGRFKCRLKSKPAPPSNPANCRCGEIKQPRIVGGNATGEHEFPMMAGLRDINTYELFCGATIIKPDWTISAAHCFMEEGGTPKMPRDIRISVGNRDIERGIAFQVRQYFTHPGFVQNSGFVNDVSLVQSLTNMLLSDNIQPVCLPYTFPTDSLNGYDVTILGWGSLDIGRPPTTILQKVQVRVVSSNYCQQSYPDIDINSERICTYAEGKDSCQMDSGGPLLVNRGGNWFLAGIVSFGYGCASPIPSVNTRVAPYLNWITKTIGHRSICVKNVNY